MWGKVIGTKPSLFPFGPAYQCRAFLFDYCTSSTASVSLALVDAARKRHVDGLMDGWNETWRSRH